MILTEGGEPVDRLQTFAEPSESEQVEKIAAALADIADNQPGLLMLMEENDRLVAEAFYARGVRIAQ